MTLEYSVTWITAFNRVTIHTMNFVYLIQDILQMALRAVYRHRTPNVWKVVVTRHDVGA
jgi:hypothetical protein